MLVPNKLEDWTGEVVAALAAAKAGEDSRFDFKSGGEMFKPGASLSFSKAVSAFANSQGGFIVVGVEEVGTGWAFTGLEVDKRYLAISRLLIVE